ncbi:neuronal regeneration-related protein-like [Discoglossus pictus]
MAIMQSQDCCQFVRMAEKPDLTSCSSWDPYETTPIDGIFHKGYLHLFKEVNRKEISEAGTFLTQEIGCGYNFTEIDYLFLF